MMTRHERHNIIIDSLQIVNQTVDWSSSPFSLLPLSLWSSLNIMYCYHHCDVHCSSQDNVLQTGWMHWVLLGNGFWDGLKPGVKPTLLEFINSFIYHLIHITVTIQTAAKSEHRCFSKPKTAKTFVRGVTLSLVVTVISEQILIIKIKSSFGDAIMNKAWWNCGQCP